MLPTPDMFVSVRISRLPLQFTETFCHWEYDKVTLVCGLYYKTNKRTKNLTRLLLIQ